MAGNGNITISGLPELQRALQRAQTEALAVVKKQVATSGQELQQQAQQELAGVGGVDTGQLQGNIRYRASDAGLGAEVAAPNPVAAAVEFGTAPAGQLKQHMPPPDALQDWAERHGLPPKSGGFLAARAIARRGTRARPWLSVAYKKISRKFADDMRAQLNSLLDGLK